MVAVGVCLCPQRLVRCVLIRGEVKLDRNCWQRQHCPWRRCPFSEVGFRRVDAGLPQRDELARCGTRQGAGSELARPAGLSGASRRHHADKRTARRVRRQRRALTFVKRRFVELVQAVCQCPDGFEVVS